MIKDAFLFLTYNMSLLLLLVYLFDIFGRKWLKEKSIKQQIFIGIVLGFIGIIIIQTHWKLENGAIFDTRSIMLSVVALFFGAIPTIIAVFATIMYRFFLGGVGVVTGVSVILATTSIGLAYRYIIKRDYEKLNFTRLYVFGLVVHVVMILLMLIFPWQIAVKIIKTITLPVMIIYPLGTALLGTIIINRLKLEKQIDRIKENELKFRIVAEYTSDWDYWISPERKLIYCSESVSRITGFTVLEIEEDTDLIEKMIFPEDLVLYRKAYSVSEVKQYIKFIIRIYDKFGNTRWISHSSMPVFDDENKFLGYRVSNRDITEQKEIEQQLLKSKDEVNNLLEITNNSRVALLSMVEDLKLTQTELEKINNELEERVELRTSQLQAANKELEAFSYSVSHDLRAPLRGVSGFANMLIEDYGDKMDDEAKRICNAIIDNSKRMGILIDDLLSFSRLARKDLNKSEIDMKTLFNSIYHEVSSIKEREKIRFEIDEIEDCYGDPNLLRQVLSNLLSNAIKFSSREEISEIRVYGEKSQKNIKYFIEDNGVGFDMKYKDKLFTVFQRLHSVADFKGTGVGLAIVQRIISRHGGEVGADAELNKGAKFWFTLPLS